MRVKVTSTLFHCRSAERESGRRLEWRADETAVSEENRGERACLQREHGGGARRAVSSPGRSRASSFQGFSSGFWLRSPAQARVSARPRRAFPPRERRVDEEHSIFLDEMKKIVEQKKSCAGC